MLGTRCLLCSMKSFWGEMWVIRGEGVADGWQVSGMSEKQASDIVPETAFRRALCLAEALGPCGLQTAVLGAGDVQEAHLRPALAALPSCVQRVCWEGRGR